MPLSRIRADGVKDEADITKQALDVSEKAIEKAKKALKEAVNNLNSTRNATAEVQHAGFYLYRNLTHLSIDS